jgi:hypothetical protein
MQQMFDPRLDAALAKGDWADYKTTTRKQTVVPGGQCKQRSAVPCPGLCSQLAHGPLVAGKLHIPRHQRKREPDERIEPVQRQRRKSQRLDQVIPSADMHLFMRQNIGKLLRRQTTGR